MHIYSLGESLIRYDFGPKDTLQCFATGTSINFLANLNQLGATNLEIITGLSSQKDGDLFVKKLNEHQIGTSFSFWSANLPMGSYQIYRKHSIYGWEVVYNRASSVWNIAKKHLAIPFQQGDILHFDGISLLQSPVSLLRTKSIVQAAFKKEVQIAFDFNYRQQLAPNTPESEVRKSFTMAFTMAWYVHISIYDLKWFLKTDESNPRKLLTVFAQQFAQLKLLVCTQKINNDNGQKIRAFMYSQSGFVKSPVIQYNPRELVGQGDAFFAFVIKSLTSDNIVAIDKALKWSVLKANHIGDATIPTISEFRSFLDRKNIIR